MVTEIELKYSLLEDHKLDTSEQIQATISQLLSKHNIEFVHHEKQLSNYYFDTADFFLRKSRIALRTRGTKIIGESECFEQTIKTSGTVIAGLHQRPEYNVDINNDKPILDLFPSSIWKPNTDIQQLQNKIIELFSTHFTRHTWLVNIEKTQVEIAFDCGEIACIRHTNKPRIYEVELELVSGDTQALFILTRLLFSQLALRPGQLTKAARGYALYRESSQCQAKGTEPGKSSSQLFADNNTSSPKINASNCIEELNGDFPKCIETLLNNLQTSVDAYVEEKELNAKVSKISTVYRYLESLEQVFAYFEELSTLEEIALHKDLICFIHVLTASIKSVQSDLGIGAKIITLLHSEDFNNLQLRLLGILLKRNNDDEKK